MNPICSLGCSESGRRRHGGAVQRHLNNRFGYSNGFLCFLLFVLALAAFLFTALSAAEEEFVGPLPGWLNVRQAPYNASGLGIIDDTVAIQTALNDCAKTGKSTFVYFPAGTYRITNTLTLTALRAPHVIGENPATTTIAWDGGSGSVMFYLHGCADGVLSRLTFDGKTKGVAGIATDTTLTGGELYAGNWIFSDLTIKNVTKGLTAGDQGNACAESMVIRCRFQNNFIHGFRVGNYNALNWWLWYDTFEDCATAIHGYQGGLHVARSVFKRSTVQDIYMENGAAAGIRHNYSIGSKKFYGAGNYQGGEVFHGNVILDTTDAVAIQINGNDAFIDNIIRSKVGNTGPAINMYGRFNAASCDLTAIGNTFTVAVPYLGANRKINVDEVIANRASVNPVEPTMPPTPPNLNRAIFEVAASGNGIAIQTAINQAAASVDANPVVYIRAGNHSVSQTIVVPALRQMQIIGEGMWGVTKIGANGVIGQPVIRFDGPSRAVVRDLIFEASPGESVAPTVLMDNADQVGGRFYVEHVTSSDFLNPDTKWCLLVDQLDETVIEGRGFNLPSVKVIGGPQAAAGNPGQGRVRFFGSNSGWFDVAGFGSLQVSDLYTEVGTQPSLKFDGSGNFTMSAGGFKRTAMPTAPCILLEDYAGKATFLGIMLTDNPIEVRGRGADCMAFFNVCMDSHTNYTGAMYNNVSPLARTSLANAIRFTNLATPVPNTGTIDDQFVRDMLAQERSNVPFSAPLSAVPTGAMDARWYHVQVSHGVNGIKITGGNADHTPPAIPAKPNVDSPTSAMPTLSGTTEAKALVTLYDGASLIGSVKADAAGVWSFKIDLALSIGSHGFKVTATDQADNTSGFSPICTVTVSSGYPVITTQPANTWAFAGRSATFSIVASGTPSPTFQWQFSHDGGVTWNAVAGAISQQCVLSAVTLSKNGDRYRCLVMNSNGSPVSNVAILTVLDSSGLSLFGNQIPTEVNADDPSAVEVGMKFVSTQAGQVKAIRFYKGPLNTGTHVGHLWSASGTLLASATFTGETASGWQQVALSPAISITPNTTYVVSYFAPNGRYAATSGGFSNRVTLGPLYGPSDTESGGNGVYRYGPSAFPNQTFGATNYWVDLVFVPDGVAVIPKRSIRMNELLSYQWSALEPFDAVVGDPLNGVQIIDVRPEQQVLLVPVGVSNQ